MTPEHIWGECEVLPCPDHEPVIEPINPEAFARVSWPVKHCPSQKAHIEPHIWGYVEMWGKHANPGNSFLCPGKMMEAELSKLLFEAREQVDMWADVVEAKGGKPASHARSVVERIDAYRRRRGWSPDGFGGESAGVGKAELSKILFGKHMVAYVAAQLGTVRAWRCQNCLGVWPKWKDISGPCEPPSHEERLYGGKVTPSTDEHPGQGVVPPQ
jgi:hypothetical protein